MTCRSIYREDLKAVFTAGIKVEKLEGNKKGSK